MKVKDWLYISGIALLAILLLRAEFCSKPKTVEVVKVVPVDLDSLKRAKPPDTVFLPGPERQVLRYVTVPIPDQRTADSLADRFAELANRYALLQAKLQSTWDQGSGDTLQLDVERHTYIDSMTTTDYFHRWEIIAEGPIVSYMPQVVPFCPGIYVPASKPVKQHRVGIFFGGQTAQGALRPVYSGKYSYNWMSIQAAYLPGANHLSLPGEFQLSAGIEIPIR